MNTKKYVKVIEKALDELGFDVSEARDENFGENDEYSWYVVNKDQMIVVFIDETSFDILCPVFNSNQIPDKIEFYKDLLKLADDYKGITTSIDKDNSVMVTESRVLEGLDKDEALEAIALVTNCSEEIFEKLKFKYDIPDEE